MSRATLTRRRPGPRSRPATAATQRQHHDVTRRQAEYLIDQFDTNMFPKESAAFSVAPDRDGSQATSSSGVDSTGDGDKIMTLVDNVRDDNFYDFHAARPTSRASSPRSSTSCSTATS